MNFPHVWTSAFSNAKSVRLFAERSLDYFMASWRHLENHLHPFEDFNARLVTESDLAHWLGLPVDWRAQVRRDSEFSTLQRHLENTTSDPASFPSHFCLRPEYATLVYALVRFLGLQIVIETGVANGLSTGHILAALAANGSGHLYSIDYPPLDPFQRKGIGILVPNRLRFRWNLRLDDSVRGLRRILRRGIRADLFLHDGEHTYLQMLREFSHIFPSLSPRGILLADDSTGNSAFSDFARHMESTEGATWGIMGRLGVLRKRNVLSE